MADPGEACRPLGGPTSTQALQFEFGKNWRRFLQHLTPGRIAEAEASLVDILETARLDGKRFLDVGSGSGLFSLAARRLGARVHSFDRDRDSVECTRALRRRYCADDPDWTIEVGSVLDEPYLGRLGMFEVVYAWGVLHHTGEMWRAMEHVAPLVRPGGALLIAIYNDQGRASRRWRLVKRAYNRLPRGARSALLLAAVVRLWGPTVVRGLCQGRPLRRWREYERSARGMSPWRDVVDWVGGYPFEVAKAEEVFDFFRVRGFVLNRLKTCGGGLGCNEYLFIRAP